MVRTLTLAGALGALALSSTLAFAGPGEAGHSHKSFAAGEPGDPKKPVARTIEVTMKETEDAKMLFEPDRVEIKRGEQVKFVLKNTGKVDHEFMLDSVQNNAKHKVAMEQNPDMEHDDPNGKRLAPSTSNEIVWRFTKAGTFEYACLIPGHYESGMKATVIVK
ncbi:cupredoxin domain-containing protein [Microvirga arsenatis]|uniref:Copper resistance protein n=1 Tax=Microvirga arsenatis TaxID=2692265 RepID=A0ABW9Z2T5_9HYPH|nr:cupredoxin family protein [Microvirga arsenatis]NBJ13054.1 copper resistance protein [Microvirga arsenatis]NBJ26827.1 copper resistance protein [Microvirga arsenatis]